MQLRPNVAALLRIGTAPFVLVLLVLAGCNSTVSTDRPMQQREQPAEPKPSGPRADAGPDLRVFAGDDVILHGIATDAGAGGLVYAWSYTAGTPSVVLRNAYQPIASFTVPVAASDTVLEFTFKVTDSDGVTSADNMTVTVLPSSTPTHTRERDPVVPYLYWEIGARVPLQYQSDLRRGIQLMHEYAIQHGLPMLRHNVTFYLFYDRDLLVAALVRAGGASAAAAEKKLDTIFAEAAYDFIFFNTQRIREGSYSVSPVLLSWVAAHELAHIHQYGPGGFGKNFDTDHAKVRVHGPVWMQEGAAEFLALRVLSGDSIISYDQGRADFVRRVSSIDADLSELETYVQLKSIPGAYTYGALAVELLIHLRSIQAYYEYWALLGPHTTWERCFEQAFGMRIDTFYAQFKEHREAGFPEL